MKARVGFRRMETNEELLTRCFKARPGSWREPDETIDQYAERCGLQRRIVEDEA